MEEDNAISKQKKDLKIDIKYALADIIEDCAQKCENERNKFKMFTNDKNKQDNILYILQKQDVLDKFNSLNFIIDEEKRNSEILTIAFGYTFDYDEKKDKEDKLVKEFLRKQFFISGYLEYNELNKKSIKISINEARLLFLLDTYNKEVTQKDKKSSKVIYEEFFKLSEKIIILEVSELREKFKKLRKLCSKYIDLFK